MITVVIGDEEMIRLTGPPVICVVVLLVMTEVAIPGLIAFVVQLVAAVALSALVLRTMGLL